MKKYSIKQLAVLAGVSVRTLHYYDETGLLKPHEKSGAGYRFYSHDDLLRLQQIMLYKELGLSLLEIQSILDNPDFDLKKALTAHRKEIARRREQFTALLDTIDKTLQHLHKKTMLSDKDMYKGFSKEQAEAYRKEAAEKWGEQSVRESEQRVRKMSPKQWEAVKVRGEEITQKLADIMGAGVEPSSREVQQCIADWHKWLENFYPVTEERLRGLGQMYVDDERFRAHYDKFRKGLAEFKNRAINIYCDNGMKVK